MHWILGLILMFLAGSARAAGPISLPQLSPSQTGPLFDALASSYIFRPLEPASDLGRTYAFAIGATAGLADGSPLTPVLGVAVPWIPSGDFNLALQYPKGFGVEIGILPPVALSGVRLAKYAGTLKWTFLKFGPSANPASLCVRAGYTYGGLDYSQPLSGGTVDMSYASHMAQGLLSVSEKFWILEPYVGAGAVARYSSITGTGTVNLFGTTFPVGTTSASGSSQAFWFNGGLQMRLDWVSVGAEYDYLFGIHSVSAKIAFRG